MPTSGDCRARTHHHFHAFPHSKIKWWQRGGIVGGPFVMSMEPFVTPVTFARWIPPFGMFNWMQSGRCFCGCQKDFSGAFFNVKNTRRRPRARNRKGFYLKIFLGTNQFHLLFLVFYGIIRADNEKLSKNPIWR